MSEVTPFSSFSNKSFFGNRSKPYLIAELGSNHENSIEKAKLCIEQAKIGGADGIKFQCFKAEDLISTNIFDEKVKAQYEYLKKYDKFTNDDYITLANYAKELNLDFIATPFSLEYVDFLENLVPFYKIASGDLNCIPLLKTIANKKKPILLSTGSATINEIKNSLKVLENNGATEIVIMHCRMAYPCSVKDQNLDYIPIYKELFPKYVIGYSDHSLADDNMLNLTFASLLGAKVIEKHFTFDKKFFNNDHFHSMDFNDLKKLSNNLLHLEEFFLENNFIKSQINFTHLDKYDLVNFEKKILPIEYEIAKSARRSIVIAKRIKKNSILTQTDLTFKRPAYGISVENWEEVLGRTISKDLNEDHILKWEDLI